MIELAFLYVSAAYVAILAGYALGQDKLYLIEQERALGSYIEKMAEAYANIVVGNQINYARVLIAL